MLCFLGLHGDQEMLQQGCSRSQSGVLLLRRGRKWGANEVFIHIDKVTTGAFISAGMGEGLNSVCLLAAEGQ